MSVQSPGYPGLCCFRSISPAALRLDGLLVVVRPVGFPAALRLAGLLAGGAACGIPGGAAPGLATRWWCGLWDG
ncbi:hypothetical protein P0O97_11840 [Klebsiella aerogenes]|uniref:hypothetical protein n=1 Tax=Klebsiella aerogenes TaxID=548 RepID=UPI0023BA1314|nr:hypothetical protein [Klebsiella aerogenes]ELA1888206.1 hypothetical protein [Klebsiella aerogenes]MDF0549074.1 hypothetical protein [Klebsiella aerogenes]